MKQEKNASKNGNLMEPGDRDGNEIEMIKKDEEADGQEGGDTGEP